MFRLISHVKGECGQWTCDLSVVDICLTYCSQTGNHDGTIVAIPGSYFTQQDMTARLSDKLGFWRTQVGIIFITRYWTLVSWNILDQLQLCFFGHCVLVETISGSHLYMLFCSKITSKEVHADWFALSHWLWNFSQILSFNCKIFGV